MGLPRKINPLLDDRNDIPILDEHQIEELFSARCNDLEIEIKEKQFKRFAESINEKCINRKLNLTNMFLGPITATLVAKWIMLGHIDITHLFFG